MNDGKPAGWLARLGAGLKKSSGAIAGGLTRIFTHKRIDAATIDELEDLLITADLGPATAAKLAG
ncbi:MAG: signal recognition particle receptor subunit alpha, partial [Alphaproteobacteria bacterium]